MRRQTGRRAARQRGWAGQRHSGSPRDRRGGEGLASLGVLGELPRAVEPAGEEQALPLGPAKPGQAEPLHLGLRQLLDRRRLLGDARDRVLLLWIGHLHTPPCQSVPEARTVTAIISPGVRGLFPSRAAVGAFR